MRVLISCACFRPQVSTLAFEALRDVQGVDRILDEILRTGSVSFDEGIVSEGLTYEDLQAMHTGSTKGRRDQMLTYLFYLGYVGCLCSDLHRG